MADETKYAVGQVVVCMSRYNTDRFECGTQVVYFGRPGEDSASCHVTRGGTSDIMDLKDIRPLRPGEAPTLDARGYPIEAKDKIAECWRWYTQPASRTFTVTGDKLFVHLSSGRQVEVTIPAADEMPVAKLVPPVEAESPAPTDETFQPDPDDTEDEDEDDEGIDLVAIDDPESLVTIANDLDAPALVTRTVTITTTIDTRGRS